MLDSKVNNKNRLENFQILNSAATNTRLMGVVGAMLCYEYEGTKFCEFFIVDYDIRELGRHEILVAPGEDDIRAYSDEVFGSLGGELVKLDFETDFLNLFFGEARRSAHDSYKQAVKKSPLLSAVDKRLRRPRFEDIKLFPKHELSDYEIVHYFLMRYFECDELAFDLCDQRLDIEDWDFEMSGMVVKNTLIEPEPGEDARFFDFSLILFFGPYFLINGSVGIEDGAIIEFEVEEVMELPPDSVAKMMRKEELITIYQIVSPSFETAFCIENRRIIPQLYNAGTLFVSYKKDNFHVDSPVYTVNADIEASLFATDSGQLVVCTDESEEGYAYLERLQNRYGNQLIKIADYLFDDRVFLDFVESSRSDFLEWIEGGE